MFIFIHVSGLNKKIDGNWHGIGVRTVNEGVTEYTFCYTEVKYMILNTTNLSFYIKNHHPDKVPHLNCTRKSKSESTNTVQLRLKETFKNKLSVNSPRAQNISTSIGLCIAVDIRSYSIVENHGFRNLISTLELSTHFCQTVFANFA